MALPAAYRDTCARLLGRTSARGAPGSGATSGSGVAGGDGRDSGGARGSGGRGGRAGAVRVLVPAPGVLRLYDDGLAFWETKRLYELHFGEALGALEPPALDEGQ